MKVNVKIDGANMWVRSIGGALNLSCGIPGEATLTRAQAIELRNILTEFLA